MGRGRACDSECTRWRGKLARPPGAAERTSCYEGQTVAGHRDESQSGTHSVMPRHRYIPHKCPVWVIPQGRCPSSWDWRGVHQAQPWVHSCPGAAVGAHAQQVSRVLAKRPPLCGDISEISNRGLLSFFLFLSVFIMSHACRSDSENAMEELVRGPAAACLVH